MATATRSREMRRGTRPVQVSALPRRHPRATQTPERRLAEAAARELRARHALAQAFADMERAHALAVRKSEQFDAYLNDVRKRLRREGYLGTGHCDPQLS